MQNLFIVSDIHGHIQHFETLLNYWDKQQPIAILGDLIDRGPQSLAVIQKVMGLKEQYGEKVIFLKGNHEDMLVNFLHNPTEKKDHYFRNGGFETLESFFKALHKDIPDNVLDIANTILQYFPNEINFIKEAPHYYIFHNILLTHAGFNAELDDFTQTSDREFIWIRKHYLTKNNTGYVNVFGHTPIKYINEQNDILVSDDGLYIAIDGGCYMTGQLNGILLKQTGEIINKYSVTLPIIAKYD